MLDAIPLSCYNKSNLIFLGAHGWAERKLIVSTVPDLDNANVGNTTVILSCTVFWGATFFIALDKYRPF